MVLSTIREDTKSGHSVSTIFGEIQWSIAIHKPHGTSTMAQSIQMEHCLIRRTSTTPRDGLCCLKCTLTSRPQRFRLTRHREAFLRCRLSREAISCQGYTKGWIWKHSRAFFISLLALRSILPTDQQAGPLRSVLQPVLVPSSISSCTWSAATLQDWKLASIILIHRTVNSPVAHGRLPLGTG